MARKSRLTDDPEQRRGSALTPEALSKQEFGRRLQKMLDERNWSQADLARAAEGVSHKKMGRDAISTYINGRSFPTPASLNVLCKALGVERGELLPNAIMNGTQSDHPAFEMRAAAGHPGQAWVRVNRMMRFETAAEIVRLINEEDRRARGGE